MTGVQLAPEYTDEDRVKGFLALLRCAGDAEKASAELHADGLPVEPEQLLEWRDRTHPTLYVTLADEQGRALEEMIAARSRENALRGVTVEGELLNKLSGMVAGAMSITDVSRALDAVQKARSSGVDGVLKLTGRPVDGKGGQDPREIVKALQRLGVPIQLPGFDAETDAVEVPELDGETGMSDAARVS